MRNPEPIAAGIHKLPAQVLRRSESHGMNHHIELPVPLLQLLKQRSNLGVA